MNTENINDGVDVTNSLHYACCSHEERVKVNNAINIQLEFFIIANVTRNTRIEIIEIVQVSEVEPIANCHLMEHNETSVLRFTL